MISIAVIVFREVLEIALVVSVLLAATRGISGRSRWTLTGLVLGVLLSFLVAFFAESISSAAEGMGQELFNATVLLVAAALIAWTVIWMRRYGRTLTQRFKEVGQSICRGEKPLSMLALVVALAVLREGSEIVLFTYGVLAQGTAVSEILAGSAFGLLFGMLIGFALYFGLVRISPKHLFGVTSWLLIALAAGMVSQAAGFLSAAGWAPEIIPQIWDTSHFLPEQSLAGKILQSLLGYTDKPSGLQLAAYLTTLGVIAIVLKLFGNLSSGSMSEKAKKVGVVALLLTTSATVLSRPVEAFPKVYSPIVVQGELEIEAQGSYTFDDREEKDEAQVQKHAIGYGVTDRWFTEFYVEYESEPEEGNDLEYSSFEWENRLQLFEQGKYWLDAGLYFAYEVKDNEESPDKLEGKLLLEKQIGSFVHDLNVILEKPVGGHLEDGEDRDVEGGLAWSTRYRLRPEIEPGFEVHYEAGPLEDHRQIDEQELLVGPVVYGKIGPFKYDVGYLFGTTDDSPDGQLKWVFEFEHYF